MLSRTRPTGPTRYSVIRWSYSPKSAGGYPACSWITYSEADHKRAMRSIKARGGYVYDWQ